MSRRLAVLGSTGSIGTQTLEVLRNFPDEFDVVALTTHSSLEQVKAQADEFSPELVGVTSEKLRGQGDSDWQYGPRVLTDVLELDLDMLVLAVVGTAGLQPCISALKEDVNVALANKEVLAAAGSLIKNIEQDSAARLLPVDSEHSALFQALQGENYEEISRLIITASGGPFLRTPLSELQQVKPEAAFDHPNWEMGSKITIDSATMMNKGLEVIEACHLFNLLPEQVDAFVHPQSTVHGLVEFVDNSILAQCSVPDMKLPIQYALFYPRRRAAVIEPIDFTEGFSWEFEPIDSEKFSAYRLACDALEAGDSYPAVLNAANEVTVDGFINGAISFLDIPRVVERCMEAHEPVSLTDLETVLAVDREAREQANGMLKNI